jgi:hypothetical protein
MKGNGNMVSNAVTLSWFATQYWMGGTARGRRISGNPVTGEWTWISIGSMPGTSAFLAQFITAKGRAAGFCVIMPIRVPNAQQTIIPEMTQAMQGFLQAKFRML